MGTDLTRPADVLEAIRTGDIQAFADPRAAALSIVESILNAETAEQAFDTGGTVAAKDLVGEVVTLHGVRLMPGEIEDASLPVYVLLDTEREDGQRMIVNTGSARIVGQSLFALIRNMLPLKVAIIEVAKPKAGQNAPLGLAIH